MRIRLALVCMLSLLYGLTVTTPSLAAACPFSNAIDAINQKAQQNPSVGLVVQGPWVTPSNDGCFVHYQNGSIYWSTHTPASLVYGLIRDKWAKWGWERGALGYPITDEQGSSQGRFNQFQHGIIIWKKGTPEAFVVIGSIYHQYATMGFQDSALGYPISDELNWSSSSADVGGQARISHFDNGAIVWLPDVPGIGTQVTTPLVGGAYACWMQKYEDSGRSGYIFPMRISKAQGASYIMFADAGRELLVVQYPQGTLKSCTELYNW